MVVTRMAFVLVSLIAACDDGDRVTENEVVPTEHEGELAEWRRARARSPSKNVLTSPLSVQMARELLLSMVRAHPTPVHTWWRGRRLHGCTVDELAWIRPGLAHDRDRLTALGCELRTIGFGESVIGPGKSGTEFTPPENAERGVVSVLTLRVSWRRPFDPALTKAGSFMTPRGRRPAKFMAATLVDAPYNGSDRVQLLAVPFRGSLLLWILLPRPGITIAEIEHDLNVAHWRRLRAGVTACLAQLELPVVDIESAIRIETPDGAVGNQLTRVRWDEDGMDAKARTTLFVLAEPVKVVVNRPFVFMVEDSKTGKLLIVGSVVSPLD